MELVLDRNLQPLNHQWMLNSEDEELRYLPNKFKDKTESVYRHSIPENAAIYHVNYLEYIQTAYQRHLGIVVSPETFWYSVMAEFAQEVLTRPDAYREIFTRQAEGKIDILVPCAAADEPLRMDDILAQMIRHLPIDPDICLPTFTTSTELSRLATLAAFLETASPYYNYMMFACGIPKVKVLGTRDDWLAIFDRLVQLQDIFRSKGEGKIFNYLIGILGITQKILGQISLGSIASDIKFWQDIFKDKRCGSGSQYFVDGWWSRVMYMNFPKTHPEVCNFNSHITKVPYTVLPTNEKWKLCFGLTHSYEDADGFFHPQFSQVQVKIEKAPPAEKEAKLGFTVYRAPEASTRKVASLEEVSQPKS